MQGCIELVQAAVRKILRREAQVGDSFVEIGLDSVSSMSLHSVVCESAGSTLPTSIFYDHPTILSVARLIHKQAKIVCSGSQELGSEAMDDIDVDTSLLGSVEARQSYHLSLAREALLQKDFRQVQHQCQQCRNEGSQALGVSEVAILRLEAEAYEGLGLFNEWRDAAEAGLAKKLENLLEPKS